MVTIKDCGLAFEAQLGTSAAELIDWAKYADRSGYGYIFRSDHLLPTIQDVATDSPECWVTLGAIAASTNSVKFGPMVTPIGFRNPALLARMACTLHTFTGGRLVLSIGAGWFKDEYAAHGIKFPNFRVRKEQFLEAVKIIRPLTEGKEVDFQGKYYTAHTKCLLKPKGKVDFIIGAQNRELMEIAAVYADELNIDNTTLEILRDAKKLLHAKGVGRQVRVSRMGSFMIGENKKELELKLSNYSKLKTYYSRLKGGPFTAENLRRIAGFLCGTVDEFVSQVNEFIEAGAERFYFQVLNTQDKQMVELLTQTLKERI